MKTNRKTLWGRALHAACLLAVSAAVCLTLDSCSRGGGGHGGKSNPDISVLDGYTLTVTALREDEGPSGEISFKIVGNQAENVIITQALPEAADPEKLDIFPEVPARVVLTPVSKPEFTNRRMVLECQAYWDDGLEEHLENITIDFTFSDMVDFRDLDPHFPDVPVGSPSVSRLPVGLDGTEPMKYDIPCIYGDFETKQ